MKRKASLSHDKATIRELRKNPEFAAWTLECVRAKRPWLCSFFEVEVSGKRKGASWEACAKLDPL